MSGAMEWFVNSSAARVVYRLAGPVVRYVRQRFNGGVPNERKIVKVEYGGKAVLLHVRRWSECDRLALQQCFEDRQYDMPDGKQGEAVERVYRSIVASGRKPLVVDCGANIGASARWFGMRYPESHIVAIEPAPDNVQLLRVNTAGLDIDVRQAGIASEDGTAYLVNRFGGAEMGWQVTSEASDLPVQLVSVQTLLDDKAGYTPFLLKLDIEGAEKTLFSGDNSAIDRFPMIIMEPHDWLHLGEQISREFFRFHVEAGREFAMKHENVASLRCTGSNGLSGWTALPADWCD